jgi:hypothetical protein
MILAAKAHRMLTDVGVTAGTIEFLAKVLQLGVMVSYRPLQPIEKVLAPETVTVWVLQLVKSTSLDISDKQREAGLTLGLGETTLEGYFYVSGPKGQNHTDVAPTCELGVAYGHDVLMT